MTHYLSILAVQSPFYIGTDALKRSIYSCNYEVRIDEPTSTPNTPHFDLEVDLASLLSSVSPPDSSDLGKYSSPIQADTTIFAAPNVTLPTGAGPYIHIRATGGSSPEERHSGEKILNQTVQVAVYAQDPGAGERRAWEVFRYLDGRRDLWI